MTSKPLQPCGTPAAYQRHRKNGEEACDACKSANTAYMRSLRDRRSPLTPAEKARRNRARAARKAAKAEAVAVEKATRALIVRHRGEFEVLLRKAHAHTAIRAVS